MDLPHTIVCPITNEIFYDPIKSSTGHNFERDAIEEWLTKNKICPITRLPLTETDLTPNKDLSEYIAQYLNQNPKYKSHQYKINIVSYSAKINKLIDTKQYNSLLDYKIFDFKQINYRPLFTKKVYNHIIIEHVINNGIIYDDTPLLYEAILFSLPLDKIKHLLSLGVDTNISSPISHDCPILQAIIKFSKYGNELLKLLLDYGANVNVDLSNICCNLMEYACLYGNVETVKLLLNAGYVVKSTDYFQILSTCTCYDEKIEIFKYLVELLELNGIPINTIKSTINTNLLYQVFIHKTTAYINFLLEHNVNINEPSPNRPSPIQKLLQCSKEDYIVKVLSIIDKRFIESLDKDLLESYVRNNRHLHDDYVLTLVHSFFN